MTVFELIGTSAWIDWSSRGSKSRLGMFSTREKAEAKITELKSTKDWNMDWEEFNIIEVEVK